ncbi:MAG: lycopene cyclase domain protein, partial [Frankiales bacterium]|nr:lycopene cyclase domain protein [Frankiales bacterium]
MDYWLFDLLAVALPTALLLRGRRPGPVVVRASLLLAAVAVAWTAPWDEHLVRTGVWSYGPDRVLAVLGSVPVEEYAFVVLLVALVAAWGSRTGLLRPGTLAAGSRARTAAGWGAVAAS